MALLGRREGPQGGAIEWALVALLDSSRLIRLLIFSCLSFAVLEKANHHVFEGIEQLQSHLVR